MDLVGFPSDNPDCGSCIIHFYAKFIKRIHVNLVHLVRSKVWHIEFRPTNDHSKITFPWSPNTIFFLSTFFNIVSNISYGSPDLFGFMNFIIAGVTIMTH